MIPLTERLLADAGGWQAMKQARSLQEMGRIAAAKYEPPILEGRVREGETEYRAGLRILSKSNIENLCSCRPSRHYGSICAHSLAVGLEIIKPRSVMESATAQAPSRTYDAILTGPTFTDSGDGILLELFIVLAPNFLSGWQAGAVTVGAEVAIEGRRVLLDALDASRTFRCSAGDLRAIRRIRSLNGGAAFGIAYLSKESFLQLLEDLCGHPRVSFGKTRQAHVAETVARPKLILRRDEQGALKLHARLPAEALLLAAAAQVWQLLNDVFTPVATGLSLAYQRVLREEVTISPAESGSFLERELPGLRNFFDVDTSEVLESYLPPVDAATPPAPGFALQLEGSLKFLAAELECIEGERRYNAVSAGAKPAVKAAIDRLRRCGFIGPDTTGKLTLKNEPAILTFFARDLPQLQRIWTVTIGSRFTHVTREIERVEPQLSVRGSGEDWFELNVEMATPGGERFSASEIQRLLQSGRNSVRLRTGKLAVFNSELLDEFQQVLLDCDPKQQQPGLYRIDRRNAPYIGNIAAENSLVIECASEWRTWADAPRQLDRLREMPLGDLETVLRPYQKQGVYWLHFLAQNGLGGILADEMGLGKTVQMLAFLRSLTGQSLVVCPSSLIWNWEREAARFAPELKTLVIEGADREPLFLKIKDASLVITSYPLLRRDAVRYLNTAFQAVVLDEAQHIRNPESQNAQSSSKLNARHRFVLTGTPIENSVRDIWSLMNFAMPGYLGSKGDFRDRYEQPIQSRPNGAEQRRLMQRLKPFILRRSKRIVAPELPEKVEQVSYCKLSNAQSEIYRELLLAARRKVSALAGSKEQNKARMLMLTALLRLRQACCDLRLLPSIADDFIAPSAKLDLLDELLQEAIDGGHRVLVFSQFVEMLRLISGQLMKAEVPFCYLDGGTKDRQAVVDRFQRGETPVFLISLKAGGVGLNLTAADTVVHFDPWWNPAVEAQATDRAHRIGQKSIVTVYKLICRDTVEEKILALQAKKRGLISSLVESEQPLMEGLSMDEIAGLLEA